MSVTPYPTQGYSIQRECDTNLKRKNNNPKKITTMRTFILSICAIFCAVCAFAQDTEQDFVKFTYDNEHQFNTLTPTISGTVTNSEAASAMIMTVGGAGFGQFYGEPETLVLNGESKEFSYELSEELWGYPYYGEYYIYVGVLLMDAEGNPIETPEGEYLQAEVSYKAVTNDPATFLWTSPDGEWTSHFTFADAYADDEGAFVFTKPVILPEGSIGTIYYFLNNGEVEESSITQYTAEYSVLDGLYTVAFSIQKEGLEASAIESIEVELASVKAEDGSDINVPFMVLENSVKANPSPMKSKKSRMSLDTGNNVSVYSIHGYLINNNLPLSEVNQLPKGIYLINGKKVILK